MRKKILFAAAGFAACVALSLGFHREQTYADCTYKNSATGYEARVEDGAELLTDSEERELLSLLKDVTEYCSAAFVTIDDNPYYNTQRYAEAYSDELFYHKSAVVFVVDMEHRYLYLDSSGSARKRITSAYADTITDNIYRYASKGDYFTCGYKAFEQVRTLMKGQRIAQPMKYISNALLAVTIAMLLNFILVKMLSRTSKPSRQELIYGIYSQFAVHDAKAVFTHQSKTYSPQSSGGGGGGHSGGGGGHSGGGHSGGGHRF